ncbi:MAG: hypothetical protein ACK4VO_06525 [Pseudobdellovibrio sp.]
MNKFYNGVLEMIEFRKRLFIFYVVAISTMYAIKHIGTRQNTQSKKTMTPSSLALQVNR